jgi:hypothetical protein
LQFGNNFKEEGIMKLPQWFSMLVLAACVFSVPVPIATAQSVIKITAPSGASSSASFAPLEGEDPGAGVPTEFFGLHIHHLDVPYKQGASSWPFIPFGSWRLWGAYVEWKDLEPQKGQWNFRRLDRYVDEAGRHDIELLLTLGRTPQWASARPNEDCKGCAAEPASVEDWKNYVRAVSRRYKGKIKFYEIWNEPRFYELERGLTGNKVGYYSGSVGALVELAKAAKEVLAEEDPAARVVSPAFVSDDLGLRRLAFFFKAGGGKYIDIVSFHYYVDIPEKIPVITRKMRSLLTTYQLDRLPIFNTESGFTFERDDLSVRPGARKGSFEDILPDRLGAAYVSRSLILGASDALRRFYWFNWDGEPPHPTMGIAAVRGSVATPMTRAYQRTRNWLLGSVVGPCEAQRGKLVICDIRLKGGRNGWLAWATDQEIVADMSSLLSTGHIERLLGDGEDPLGDSSRTNIGPEPVLIYR